MVNSFHSHTYQWFSTVAEGAANPEFFVPVFAVKESDILSPSVQGFPGACKIKQKPVLGPA